jgi:hypothetical protein
MPPRFFIIAHFHFRYADGFASIFLSFFFAIFFFSFSNILRAMPLRAAQRGARQRGADARSAYTRDMPRLCRLPVFFFVMYSIPLAPPFFALIVDFRLPCR